MPTLPWARGRLAPVCQPAFCMPSVVFPGAASSVRIAPSLSALPLTPLPPPPARLPRRIRQFYVYMLAVKAPEFSVCIFPCQRAASSVSLWPSVGVLVPNPPPPRAPSPSYSCTRTEVRSLSCSSALTAACRSATRCQWLRGSKGTVMPIAAISLGPLRTRWSISFKVSSILRVPSARVRAHHRALSCEPPPVPSAFCASTSPSPLLCDAPPGSSLAAAAAPGLSPASSPSPSPASLRPSSYAACSCESVHPCSALLEFDSEEAHWRRF